MLNSMKIAVKQAYVEIHRLEDKLNSLLSASDGSESDLEYHKYIIRRTSIDAERALKHLRRALDAMKPQLPGELVQPVAVPEAAKIDSSVAQVTHFEPAHASQEVE